MAPEGYDETRISPTRGGIETVGQLQSLMLRGPAGPIEALWKEPSSPRAGSAVFAHPHPLYGGTLHGRGGQEQERTLKPHLAFSSGGIIMRWNRLTTGPICTSSTSS